MSRTTAASQEYKTVRLFGTEYVDARAFAAHHALTAKWLVPGEKLRLENPWTTLDLAVDSLELRLNDLRLFLFQPAIAHNGTLLLGSGDIENTLSLILAPKLAGAAPPLRTIAIDAGHGGNDPGNQNKSLKLDEKVFTLDVAKRLEQLLKQQGFHVVMTRTRDHAVTLEDRTAIAAKARADLFVSIHFNSFTRDSVQGSEIYVMTPRGQRSSPEAERDDRMVTTAYPSNRYDNWNVLLGYHMHRQIVSLLKEPDRGLKHFRYSVLRTAECPAVLVEAAFLSNPVEGRKVAIPAYRQEIAAAVAAGIKAYAASLDRIRTAKD
ncbi:MAG: N-acetylmuramoyl-L-alanine amidase [Opitutaceae bacterium]